MAPPSTEEDGVKGENVVLLHGLGRSSANMLILKWRLQARGYEVCNVGYETRVDSIEAASDGVFASLTDCFDTQQPTHFVTHSLGGLVLRSLLDRHAVDRTGRAVMLAPPNRGSEIADWVRSFPISGGLMGRLAGQLGTRPEDIPRDLPVPSIAFGVIAGDRWINPVGPWLLPSPHDGTVSVASTRLDGMLDHLVVPFLRTGRFRKRETSPAAAR
jgi:pimeloyl-ACP methyl ester carboxylesterase